jgi:hypothetical protein
LEKKLSSLSPLPTCGERVKVREEIILLHKKVKKLIKNNQYSKIFS